ncbi:hypothetical protein L3C95_16265 [Chitinophaga filiformis]|uniref:hypothetical protein n=1 Tax=Chitinophaga filiformis TaxID=104663 RepID=UPI001F38DE2F|nr:hypothetical protein [Chitinophaga filiformis]MCF6404453.1 hypothetical protein [Chitinophaga filiformis]
MKKLYHLLVGIVLTLHMNADAADTLTLKHTEVYLRRISRSSEQIRKKLVHHNSEALDRYIRRLEALEKRVTILDKQTAEHLFPPLITKARTFRSNIARMESMPTQYFGYLDSLQGSVKFIEQRGTDGLKKFGKAKQSVTALQNEVAITEQTSAIIEEGKRDIAAVLQSLAPNIKELAALQEQFYYYRQQVEEYKSLLSNPDKATQKFLEILRKRSDFAAFMSKNSLFASLLGLPENYNSARSLEDLQTRAQVENALARSIGSDQAGRQMASAQMDAARSQLDNFKSKFSSLEHIDETPNFKPKPLKTKRFLDRLEPGGNIQFQKANLYFPTTADIIAQLGYKFHKDGIVGIGIAYKLGMGQGWDHVAFSHQGFGIRSFLDWKLKGSLYVNGGIEGNKPTGFRQLRELRNWNGYQLSALLGICRKISVGGNKKATTCILYDFLASRQIPKSQPFKLRFGYNFK